MTVLVTNTNVPRSTRRLVAKVRALRDAQPALTEALFGAVASVAEAFLAATASSEARQRRGGWRGVCARPLHARYAPL